MLAQAHTLGNVGATGFAVTCIAAGVIAGLWWLLPNSIKRRIGGE